MLTRYQSWERSAREMSASPEEVHLWKASLDQPESVLEDLAASLSANERCRAGRFCFERDRRRFIAARGVLRDILGRYLRVPAGSVNLVTLQHGKPELADRTGNGLQFNLSHSHDLAVYAITCRRKVGVDIERVRTMSIDAMARLVFSPDECNTLSAATAIGDAPCISGRLDPKGSLRQSQRRGFRHTIQLVRSVDGAERPAGARAKPPRSLGRRPVDPAGRRARCRLHRRRGG